MGNHFGLHLDVDGSIVFLWEVYRMLHRRGEENHSGRHRSIVRLIGSSLGNQIKRPQRVTFHRQVRRSILTPLHPRIVHHNRSITITEELPTDFKQEQSPIITLPKPDVVSELGLHLICEEESKTKQNCSEEKIADLEFKLNELNHLVQQLLSGSHNSTIKPSSAVTPVPPPPPPPPPPLPPLTPVVQRPKLEKKSVKSHLKNNSTLQVSMNDVLKDMGKVKLRHVARSPGGRPIKEARSPMCAAGNLTEILKKRFASIQHSPEWQKTESDDSDSATGFVCVHPRPKRIFI